MTLRLFQKASRREPNAGPAPARRTASGAESAQQQSKLLQSVFEGLDEDRRINIFHVGPALQETLDFFSRFHCRIHFFDLFTGQPKADNDEDPDALQRELRALLEFPQDTRFDLCLFWDVFNYLETDTIGALLQLLQPHLAEAGRAHGFAVHNTRAPRKEQVYAITAPDSLAVRSRAEELGAYTPRTQGELDRLLTCFNFDRTVLLPDGRLEWVASYGGRSL